MANHPSTLTAKTPWTVWKGKQIRHWKISTPKVSDTLLGKSGGPVLIAPGRMKRLGQSGNDAQLWCIWWWTKEPLDESERGEWKSGLKTQLSENYGHGIQSHHFMANRWGNNRNSERLYLGGSKITADGDRSLEIKRHLVLGRKVTPTLDSTLKSRDITLLTKVRVVKAMVFPVIMYGCEGWTIKKDEHQRIDAFELWCWRRLLRAPWLQGDPTTQSLSKSVLNIHWKDWCWSWNSNTLATWCKELSHWKRPWCWERLKEGGEGDDRGWDG